MFFYIIENGQDRLKVERLYNQYRYLMFSEANKILHDRQLAEDAVQQSFVRIIDNLHKIDENNCNRTRNLLVIICSNIAKNILRKRLYLNKKEAMLEDIDSDTIEAGNNPLDILIDKDSVSRISKAIEQLNPIYRDVLLLKRAYGYSIEEISRILDIPPETVKKRLSRARKILSQVLEKEGLK